MKAIGELTVQGPNGPYQSPLYYQLGALCVNGSAKYPNVTHIVSGRAVLCGLAPNEAKRAVKMLGEVEDWESFDGLTADASTDLKDWPEDTQAAWRTLRVLLTTARAWAHQQEIEAGQARQAKRTQAAKDKQAALPEGWRDVGFSTTERPPERHLGVTWLDAHQKPCRDAWHTSAWGNLRQHYYYSSFPELDESQLAHMVLSDVETFEPMGNVCRQRETKVRPDESTYYGRKHAEYLAAFPRVTGQYCVHLCAHYAARGLQPALWDAKEKRWRPVGIVRDVAALLDVNASTCPWVEWTLTAKVRAELGVSLPEAKPQPMPVTECA